MAHARGPHLPRCLSSTARTLGSSARRTRQGGDWLHGLNEKGNQGSRAWLIQSPAPTNPQQLSSPGFEMDFWHQALGSSPSCRVTWAGKLPTASSCWVACAWCGAEPPMQWAWQLCGDLCSCLLPVLPLVWGQCWLPVCSGLAL
ncbi:hypothetical protein LEMLEM_LOCUS19413 [Lemmus lemmus]